MVVGYAMEGGLPKLR